MGWIWFDVKVMLSFWVRVSLIYVLLLVVSNKRRLMFVSETFLGTRTYVAQEQTSIDVCYSFCTTLYNRSAVETIKIKL